MLGKRDRAVALFFVLLAEASLAWRRTELAEIRDAIKNVRKVGAGSNRKRFSLGVWKAEEDADYEKEAIEQRDLFNDPFPYDYDFPARDDWATNPFAEYLQKVSEELEIPGIEVDEGFVSSNVQVRMPAYSVCKSDLEKITEINSLAYFWLRNGEETGCRRGRQRFRIVAATIGRNRVSNSRSRCRGGAAWRLRRCARVDRKG